MTTKRIMLKVYFIIIAVFILSGNPAELYARISGKIVGKVTDAKTGEPLPGANIIIEGTSLGAATDIKGKYIIPGLNPGNYTIIVKYIGYKDKKITVSLRTRQTLVQNVKLEYVGIEAGEEVVVVAQAEGQMAAINRQLSARAIKNVVSAARIRELPDANAAESLGRLPGVSIIRSGGEASSVRVRGLGGGANAVYVNGMRIPGASTNGNSRVVGLANVSSQMIGGIELQKAFLPDQDADVTGGGINFRLKEAPGGFKKDVFVRQGYNGFNHSLKMQDVSIALSNRFFNDKLGIIINGVYDRKNRGLDRLTASYETETEPRNTQEIVPVQVFNVGLRTRAEMRRRYGTTLNLDYQLGNGQINGQVFYSSMDRSIEENMNLYTVRGGMIQYYPSKYDQKERTLLLGLTGVHNWFWGKFDWQIYRSGSLTDRPDKLIMRAILASSLQASIDPTKGPENVIRGGTNNAMKARVDRTTFQSLKNSALENSAMANFEIPYRISNDISGFIKFGAKVRYTRRKYEQTGHTMGYIASVNNGTAIVKNALPDFGWKFTPSGAISFASFVHDFEGKEFADENVLFYYPIDFDRFKAMVDATRDKYIRQLDMEARNYLNNENFSAGYIMAGINLGPKVEFIPGVRYEYSSNKTDAKGYRELQGWGFPQDQGILTDTSATAKNTYWLPMFHLKYQATGWFDIRLSLTKTLSRPGYSNYSPRYFLTNKLDIKRGNPNLKPQTSTNYDVYLSFYTNHVGLFTIGGFYKKFENQIFTYQANMLNPADFGLPHYYKYKELIMPINNKWPGYIKGIEIDWQTHFWYLPSPLNGLILNVNYTYMRSETKYPFFNLKTVVISKPPYVVTTGNDSSRVNKITGMPDNIGNVSLGYERGGFSGRVSLYYQGFTITNAQNRIKSLDRNQDRLVRWDIQLSQKIIGGLKFFLDLNNITDWPDRTYLTYHPAFRTRQENYGWTGDVGLRYMF
ncbi:MAG: TonB-dependent receptor [Calditrichaeota bacterium]|nr:TonB-dependent receptor [Calditrichota bacterium]